MKWPELVTRLIKEHGEKWDTASKITDMLDTAIDHMDKAIDEYYGENYTGGNAHLWTADSWVERFKNEMEKIDPEIAEYFYNEFTFNPLFIELIDISLQIT